MSDPQRTIHTREPFYDRLNHLFDVAERGDVDPRGAYGIETDRDNAHYDVEVCAVVPNPR